MCGRKAPFLAFLAYAYVYARVHAKDAEREHAGEKERLAKLLCSSEPDDHTSTEVGRVTLFTYVCRVQDGVAHQKREREETFLSACLHAHRNNVKVAFGHAPICMCMPNTHTWLEIW
mmetsp:Transcript_23881/g.60398  ORF Transcript_23881/g.60398 Transcript_23881/m.60398 type:complete len:117 (+) Transcript_23881:1209-1559(+)